MPTDAERKRRPVELRLTYHQAVTLREFLDAAIDAGRPSKARASLALTRDHLKAAHKEAAAA